jgi:hypothetical protein
MKQPYFFGYLFIRAAKGLALVVILIGIGFCLLQYFQANTAASAVAYQPSSAFQRALAKLKEAFSATERIVSSFGTSTQLAAPKVQIWRFPAVIASNADFARIDDALSRLDQERQQLKQSIVNRFETSVKSIEEKLRAYAVEFESLPLPTPATASSPVSTATLLPSPAQQQESLFSSKLGVDEVNKRSANLTRQKEFLKELGTKAENADNRARLSEAADQLDSLSKLLPEKFEASVAVPQEPAATASNEAQAEQPRKPILSERIAAQLEQLRGEVRQMVLTPWALDDAFDQAAELNLVEREKCRVATFAQKGIWLSGVAKISAGLLAAVFGSFLILICADLVQSRLDTTTNTGVVADAIYALRGSVRPSSQSESRQP